MKKLNVGMIGLGLRGSSLMRRMTEMDDVCLRVLCDSVPEKVTAAAQSVQERAGYTPKTVTDYRLVLEDPEIDAVLITAAWEAHVDLAVAAMEAGKYTAMEVGGAFALEDCWRLVDTHERTGTHCMLLENCCYGRKEMLCLNLVKTGTLGQVVHCAGGYHHDLRKEMVDSYPLGNYRLPNYIVRNCENYPTHELGPIAKLLDIHRGNRMVSLVSVSSKAAGLHDYITRTQGADSDMAKLDLAQGDIVTTVIRCARGETITLTLDTTLPRAYSRGLSIHGTRGHYLEDTNALYLERDAESYGDLELGGAKWSDQWNNASTRYGAEFDHPLWKRYMKEGVRAGHGGMDWLVLRAFLESVQEGKAPPIDVYDAAAWMSVTVLSEQSIAQGSAWVSVPDFTRGKWIRPREGDYVDRYRLDTLPKLK